MGINAHKNRYIWLALVFLLGQAHAPRAAEFCTPLKMLIAQARSNFSASEPPTLTGAQSCKRARRLSGPDLYMCTWEFPYRAPRAQEAFAAFNMSVEGCFKDNTRLEEDLGVNHPDSYDLRQYVLEDVHLSVSIKDKGALQKTYVFIRIDGKTPN